ncbi:hypothetical protein IEN85_16400 [Pelagicoccus sp. NFK12]|uniref:Uncharacterized protein n=1 Tax=Pelagicoccus enzymogenes TaxID=2773457 RepID=A0A927IIB1_9BACT|nr:hypothetical protein [Pelagicoccus enzymogenes]MBD5781081.1 hypothetical protein [Pelagicoccus enzymogenes]
MSLIIAKCIIAYEVQALVSRSTTNLPCCESQAKVRSTTQRSGSSFKPSDLSLRRMISSWTFRCLEISDVSVSPSALPYCLTEHLGS